MKKVQLIAFLLLFSLISYSQGLIDSPGKIYEVENFVPTRIIGEVVQDFNNLKVCEVHEDSMQLLYLIKYDSLQNREVYKIDSLNQWRKVERVKLD